MRILSEVCEWNLHPYFVFLVKATDKSMWRSSSMSSFWRLIDWWFLVEAKTTELCVRVLLRDSVCRVFWVKCLCESWWWIFLLTPYHRSIACSNAWFYSLISSKCHGFVLIDPPLVACPLFFFSECALFPIYQLFFFNTNIQLTTMLRTSYVCAECLFKTTPHKKKKVFYVHSCHSHSVFHLVMSTGNPLV